MNALQFLSLEWNYKPASIVSYGGISGGLRATEPEQPGGDGLKLALDELAKWSEALKALARKMSARR